MWDGGEGGGLFDDGATEMQFSDTFVRHAFIRKVYGLLSAQLIVTMAIMAPFVFSDEAKNFARTSPGLLIACMVVTFVVIFAIACFDGARKKFPLNLILLAIFTMAEGVLMGYVVAAYEAKEVALAVLITFIVVVALTAFAFQTKWDITGFAPYLFVGLIVLMIFGFVLIFWTGQTARLIYAGLGCLLFSGYIVLDTQLMMGGKHKYSISPEEYIFATLNLYLDIVNLFLFILRIIGEARN